MTDIVKKPMNIVERRLENNERKRKIYAIMKNDPEFLAKIKSDVKNTMKITKTTRKTKNSKFRLLLLYILNIFFVYSFHAFLHNLIPESK